MTLKFNEIDTQEDTIIKLSVMNPTSIIVIGCGGTGSYLIPDLTRAVSFAGYKPNIILIDGDFVEEKNIKRQNFIDKDRGKNKAEVLAKRYGQTFGIEIQYLDSFLKDQEHLFNIINSSNKESTDYGRSSAVTLVISCVDRNAVRKVIQETMLDILAKKQEYRNPQTWWIDSGNEDVFGQVVLSTVIPSGIHNEKDRIDDALQRISQINPKRGYGGEGLRSFPQLKDIFPHIMQDTESVAPTISCAEEAERNPQNLLINRLAATVVLEYVYKFLYNQNITSFMSWFDCQTGEINKTFMTKRNLKKAYHQTHPNHSSIDNEIDEDEDYRNASNN